MNKEERWEYALNEVNTILHDEGVNFFLDSGTLLGAVRANKFLEWDNDIDLGVIFDENLFSKLDKVVVKLQKLGYEIHFYKYAVYILKGDIDVGIMIYNYDAELDVYKGYLATYEKNIAYFMLTVLRGEFIYTLGTRFNLRIKKNIQSVLKLMPFLSNKIILNMLEKHTKLNEKYITVPSSLFSKQSNYMFYNHSYYIPVVPEYLELRYGKEWKEPQKKWSYINDDKSLA